MHGHCLLGHLPVLRRPPTSPHSSSTAYRSVLAAEGLVKAHYFAHASLVPMSRPASTHRGPPLRFLCLVVALDHVHEISRFSLKTGMACISAAQDPPGPPLVAPTCAIIQTRNLRPGIIGMHRNCSKALAFMADPPQEGITGLPNIQLPPLAVILCTICFLI